MIWRNFIGVTFWKGRYIMTTVIGFQRRMATVLRWLARAIGTLAATFWLLILLDILACDVLVGFVCINWEIALLFGMVVFSLLSVILAWRREGTGGLMTILWGLVFASISYVTSRPHHIYSMLVTGVPFILAGCLLLASWLLNKTDSTAPMQTGSFEVEN
jgi:hypothetical protein